MQLTEIYFEGLLGLFKVNFAMQIFVFEVTAASCVCSAYWTTLCPNIRIQLMQMLMEN
jgi:hypothetical protein